MKQTAISSLTAFLSIKKTFPKGMDLSTPEIDSGDSAKEVRSVGVEVDAFMKYASDLRPLITNRIFR